MWVIAEVDINLKSENVTMCVALQTEPWKENQYGASDEVQ
jgi:hypothetical protein